MVLALMDRILIHHPSNHALSVAQIVAYCLDMVRALGRFAAGDCCQKTIWAAQHLYYLDTIRASRHFAAGDRGQKTIWAAQRLYCLDMVRALGRFASLDCSLAACLDIVRALAGDSASTPAKQEALNLTKDPIQPNSFYNRYSYDSALTKDPSQPNSFYNCYS
jgi:hypothetical protein